MQLEPFLAAYGFDSVLPVFFARLVSASQAGAGADRPLPRTREPDEMGPDAETAEHPARSAAAQPDSAGSGAVAGARSSAATGGAAPLVAIGEGVLASSGRASRRFRPSWRPGCARSSTPTSRQLGSWLGIKLDCENFDAVTRDQPHLWAANAT